MHQNALLHGWGQFEGTIVVEVILKQFLGMIRWNSCCGDSRTLVSCRALGQQQQQPAAPP